ncbi:MAG: multiheme c-type cytochrome [Gemmataceae bacterium]
MYRLRPFAVALGLSGLVLLGSHSTGQPPIIPAKALERIAGADNCIRCHLQPTPADKRPGGATEFVRMDESTIWEKTDLHGLGYEALKSKLGQQMSRLLQYDVSRAPQCLTCHAVDLMPETKPGSKVFEEFYTAFGVGCEACHGFAKDWGLAHANQAWRQKTPDEKEKLGQWDMRNPVKRADRCTSCHVGSLPEGRFVTHEMYAAGHPPLPPLEVMRHSFDQPYHYKLAQDLPYLVKLAADDSEKSWKLFHFRGKAESQPARQVAVGAIMTLRASMKLLADEAGDPKTAVLDLAQFDCAACHHDLEPYSWRQQRGFAGVPGRSQPRYGQSFLARFVADHAKAGEAKALLGDYSQLTKAFSDRPFGAKAEVKKAADKLIAYCDSALAGLDGARYDTATTKKLIHAIATAAMAPPADPKDAWVDFDTAQQLIWAIESLRTDVDADGAIGKALAEVKAKLPVHVRDATNRDFIAQGLKARFNRAAEFQPDDLFRTMKKVADLTK